MARLPKRIPAQTAVKKVRFSLPLESDSDDVDEIDEQPKQQSKTEKSIESKKDETKVHGTARYINGTLNFCGNDFKPTPAEPKSPPAKKEKKVKKIKEIVNVSTTFPRSALTSSPNCQRPIESPVCSDYWTKAFNGCKVIYASPVKSKKSNRKRTRIRSCTTILLSPTRCITRSACFRSRNKKKKQRLSNELRVPMPYTSSPRKQQTKSFTGKNHFTKMFASNIESKTNKLSMQVILLEIIIFVSEYKLSILLSASKLLGNWCTYFIDASVRSDTSTVHKRCRRHTNESRNERFWAQMEPISK